MHTPAEIIGLCRKKGLCVISITDHDTVDGVAEAIAAAEGTGLQVIPGVEISTHAGDVEIHMLGYFVDQASQEFVRVLARFRESRLERAYKMLTKLRSLGVFLSGDRVLELAGAGVVGRPHIARVLQEARYVDSVQEAFDRYLGRGQLAYVPRPKMTPVQAMHLIRQARGLPVLAHPYGVMSLVPNLAAEGLVGLEAYYGTYGPEAIACLRQLAQEHDLMCTGGSDFHGLAVCPENHLGQPRVPRECVEALWERKRSLCQAE